MANSAAWLAVSMIQAATPYLPAGEVRKSKDRAFQPIYICFEHYSWDRDNQVNYGTVEIAYIPCLEGEFAWPVASFLSQCRDT